MVLFGGFPYFQMLFSILLTICLLFGGFSMGGFKWMYDNYWDMRI